MSKPEAWKSWEGRVVDGKFPLRQWLGGSDHSAVFLTELPSPRADKAAIKLILPKEADIGHELSRLRATAGLSHPHLIRTLETGRCQMDGEPFLYVVMEKADDDLAQILPQRALEPSEVADLLPPVIEALAYLHGKRLVHGRIKPSNVLAIGDQLKLSADNVRSATSSGPVRNRLDACDAPETALGITSPEGDVWSVGALLVTAFKQNMPLAVDRSERESVVPQSIPEPFRGIARECLHLDPKRRCSPAQIQARLQPGGRSVPVETEPAPAPPLPVNRRLLFGVTLALVAILGIVLAVFYLRGKRPEVPASEAAAQPAAAPATAPTIIQPPALTKAEPPTKISATEGAVVHQVLPDVPPSAMQTISGTIKVVVRVQVDPGGKVTSATFRSSGSSKYFAGLAMKSAEQWEFSPPEVDGQPTSSTWLLQFRFKRTSTQASSHRVTR